MSNLPAENRGDILIVDDALVNLRLLSAMLTAQGYTVRAVPSGEMALTAVTAEPPDLILLDIVMPGLSGFEVCEKLKANGATQAIPIIFLSSADAVVSKVRAFQVGGVDFISKPFQIEEVVVRIQTQLKLRGLQQTLEDQVLELQNLAERLASTNNALEAVNAELNAFAETVAHDLKDPLASLILNLELAQTNLKNGKSQKADQLVDRAQTTGRRLATIIDELLMLANLRRETVDVAPLEMPQLVATALARLEKTIQLYQARIQLPDSWLAGLGYEHWVEEIWHNLIRIGLQYGGQPPALVLGSSPDEAGQVRYWIRGEEPGFAQAAIRDLLGDWLPNSPTGDLAPDLGASVAKRMIGRLGGRVGVVAHDAGRFEIFFTLPATGELAPAPL